VPELLKPFEHRKEPKIERAHVERCEFRLKRDCGLDAFLNSHVGCATAGQFTTASGRLLDSGRERGKRCRAVVRFASLPITRMQMDVMRVVSKTDAFNRLYPPETKHD